MIPVVKIIQHQVIDCLVRNEFERMFKGAIVAQFQISHHWPIQTEEYHEISV
jgi:hypothetical protein